MESVGLWKDILESKYESWKNQNDRTNLRHKTWWRESRIEKY